MGKKKRREDMLFQYVTQVAHELGLGEWSLYIRTASLKGDRANVSILYSQREAWIQFDKAWHTWTPERLRNTVVHELIHLRTNTVFITADQIESVVPEDAYKVWYQSIRAWLEETTDGLARGIQGHMPMPPEV